ncbi:LEA type 2 family protein [Poritiphilus flavus]|uniref:Late embryogenesis abundant protein LEA-2 subgroup domain-containing protein n=1 Tax=Poritiphilus flavus TaxID=2697053 RepID=A0A6L9EI48_9FLAO|nr:LEA type 2 family protein [Poritiphilus flavus]NAS14326.1 hypothetical protein [Poritiphilus flavus]
MSTRALIPILLISLCCSCRVQQPVLADKVHLKINTLDSLIRFSVDTRMYNPNGFKYLLKEILFDISYEGEKLGSGTLKEEKMIYPRDTVPLSFNCSLQLNNLHKKHHQMLSADTVHLLLEGEALAEHPLKKVRKSFSVSLPYDMKDFITNTVFNDDLFTEKIEIQNLTSFKSYGLNRSDVQFKIGFRNKQPFDLRLQRFNMIFRLKEGQRPIAQSSLDTPIKLKTKETVELPLNTELYNLNVLKNLGGIFLNAAPLELIGEGSAILNISGYDFEIPIRKVFVTQTDLFQW